MSLPTSQAKTLAQTLPDAIQGQSRGVTGKMPITDIAFFDASRNDNVPVVVSNEALAA